MMQTKHLYSFGLLIAMSLAACNLNLKQNGAPQAWIDAPLDGMHLPLAPYDIVAHASDPSGISQLEVSISNAVIGLLAGSGDLFTAHQSWTPTEPGEYLIQVRGQNARGDWGDYAQVTVFVDAGGPVAPSVSPATTAQSTEPTLVLVKNANCRQGADITFDVVNSALAGASVPIEGKNDDGSWWYVRLPNGDRCWISALIGNANGNLGGVPIVQSPPTPIPPEEPTQAPPGCFVFDPNQQPLCTVPCPPNAIPGGACTP